MEMKMLYKGNGLGVSTLGIGLLMIGSAAYAVDLKDLTPQYRPQPQSDSQRLQNFQPPPPVNNSVPSNLNLGHGVTVNPGSGADPNAFPRGTGFGANIRKNF
jgi:hypothetical protein